MTKAKTETMDTEHDNEINDLFLPEDLAKELVELGWPKTNSLGEHHNGEVITTWHNSLWGDLPPATPCVLFDQGKTFLAKQYRVWISERLKWNLTEVITEYTVFRIRKSGNDGWPVYFSTARVETRVDAYRLAIEAAKQKGYDT